MISKYRYRFLYFSSKRMNVYLRIFDAEKMSSSSLYHDSLSGTYRLVTDLSFKKYTVGKKLDWPHLICNLSFSFGHEFHHLCYNTFNQEYSVYEIEILDYDGRDRI